jgi:hypothetical protein
VEENRCFICRKFHLSLSSRVGLFSEGLVITSVGRNGAVNRHQVDTGEFFTGEVQGEWEGGEKEDGGKGRGGGRMEGRGEVEGGWREGEKWRKDGGKGRGGGRMERWRRMEGRGEVEGGWRGGGGWREGERR